MIPSIWERLAGPEAAVEVVVGGVPWQITLWTRAGGRVECSLWRLGEGVAEEGSDDPRVWDDVDTAEVGSWYEAVIWSALRLGALALVDARVAAGATLGPAPAERPL